MFVWTFFLTMTDTTTSQNIDLSSSVTLYKFYWHKIRSSYNGLYLDDGDTMWCHVPLCVRDSVFGVPAASAFREEQYLEFHSGGFLHGVGACLSDCEVNCSGEVIGLIIYFLIDCKFHLFNQRSCCNYKSVHWPINLHTHTHTHTHTYVRTYIELVSSRVDLKFAEFVFQSNVSQSNITSLKNSLNHMLLIRKFMSLCMDKF
jgi:hypothetical protein